MDLVLASTSPRRVALLEAAGFRFRSEPPDVDEGQLDGEPPVRYVVRLALDKARAVARRNPGSVVLGADTTVVVGGSILGKPADTEDAEEMLQRLAGQTHEVLTGVALVHAEGEAHAVASTRVRFLPLSPAEVRWYVATGEPFGKAGGYAIQGLGSRFVDTIEGSYANVVGLPVSLLCQVMKQCGLYDLP